MYQSASDDMMYQSDHLSGVGSVSKEFLPMSKKGCSPDNAACEGFFGRLKNEMFYGRSWIGVPMDDCINEINSYIEWYNTKRIKQSLGYMSPVEYRHSLGLAS